ncbi:hypothetical protein [Haloparvum sp. AD34]
MTDSIAAVGRDYLRRPLALPTVAGTLLAPVAFVVLLPIVRGFGEALIPAVLLVFALVGQTSRLFSAPATGLVRALLDGENPRSALDSAGTRAPERMTAAAVERLVVIPVTVVVGSAVVLVALAVATAIGAGLSELGIVAPQEGLVVTILGAIAVLMVGAGVGAVFRIGSALENVSVARRPAAGLVVATANPWTALRLVGLRTAPWVVILSAAVVQFLLDDVSPSPDAILALFLAVTVVSTALAIGLERRVELESAMPIPSLRSFVPDRRVLAVAALVLLIVSVSTFAVRVADARPSPTTAEPVEDANAATIVADANFALRHVDHFQNKSVREYNNSSGRMEPRVHYDVGANPSDREFRLHADAPDSATSAAPEAYYADGTVAVRNRWHVADTSLNLFYRQSGNWTIAAVPFQGVSPRNRDTIVGRFPDSRMSVDEKDLRVLARSDDTVTVGVEDPERLAPIYGQSAENISTDSHVRLVVDANTGRPVRLSLLYDVTTAEDRHRRHVVVEYREWGSHDVDRPAAIGDQRPLELFWDAMAY